MTDDLDLVLGGVAVDAPDVDAMTSYAGLALVVARAIMQDVTVGNLALAERVGRQYRIVGPQPPGFGDPPPWDPMKHATATILDVNGDVVCVVDSSLLVKP